MIKSIPDINALDDDPLPGEGAYRLWLQILVNSFLELRDGGCSRDPAESFLFEENIFFDAVCHELDYEPEIMRQRIRKALERAKDKPKLSFMDRYKAKMINGPSQ